MPEATVRYDPARPPLTVCFHGPGRNFILETDRISARALEALDPLCEDLLEIACAVFRADSSIRRGGDARSQMGADWRRELDFTIPVRRPDFWNRQDVRAALVDVVSFLTEDSVRFAFEAGDFPIQREPFLKFEPGGPAFDAEEVILFSGGLDSFAGALDALAASPHGKVVLVSHRSAQKVIPRQQRLGAYLRERFPGRVQHLHVTARRTGPEGKETTQRSRSLLFASLGRAVAQTLRIPRVSFYENGIISHNLPIGQQIVGTMATRTTHPLALRKLNHLLGLLGPETIRIENRFAWLTKTEVVRRIDQHGAAEQIPLAVSCTSVREQDRLHTHCGSCSQCLDRRFAILAAGLERHDPDESYAVDVIVGARSGPRSITMALEWTRHVLRLGSLDERGLLEAFGLELMRIRRGHPELSDYEVFRRIRGMHRRQAEIVESVLKAAVQDHAADLVAYRVPDTALLVMHLSAVARTGRALAGDPRPSEPASGSVGDVISEDTVPDPDAPLVAAFFHQDDIPVVAVRGLGRVQGSPAEIAHSLRPSFEEARKAGLRPECHPYVHPVALKSLSHRSKTWVRTNIGRCRAKLAEFHAALHGVPPARDLLIEGQQSRGYRLEPGLSVTNLENLSSAGEG